MCIYIYRERDYVCIYIYIYIHIYYMLKPSCLTNVQTPFLGTPLAPLKMLKHHGQ